MSSSQPLLNHIVEGDGPPVILLHGISASLFDWRRFRPALVEAGYQAITVDLYGHGASAKPADPRLYTLKAAYGTLEDWIECLDLPGSFFLVGHSLGGYLSLYYALHHPERVRAMTLINPLFSLHQLTFFLSTFMPLDYVGVGLLKRVPTWVVTSFLTLNDSFLTGLDLETRRGYGRDVKRASPDFLRIPATCPDLMPYLKAVRTPTQVVWGQRDLIEREPYFHRLVEGLPNARGHAIPGCGHQPHHGNPELTHRLILEFLSEFPEVQPVVKGTKVPRKKAA